VFSGKLPSMEAWLGPLNIAAGVYLIARYYYCPEKFSKKLRPFTVKLLGTFLIIGGLLLSFWDSLWGLLFGTTR
jgi:hypothetical protein